MIILMAMTVPSAHAQAIDYTFTVKHIEQRWFDMSGEPDEDGAAAK
jgi:hypothetical protein